MVSNVFSAKPPKTHVKVLSICQLSTAPGYGMITMSKGSSSPRQFGARTVRTVLLYPGRAEVSSWDFNETFAARQRSRFFVPGCGKTALL